MFLSPGTKEPSQMAFFVSLGQIKQKICSSGNQIGHEDEVAVHFMGGAMEGGGGRPLSVKYYRSIKSNMPTGLQEEDFVFSRIQHAVITGHMT